ncbi:MAG: hypothetical protein CMJ49_11285 [Planctomycetaceae bacterium]|nr:hypothetical protein [Planctomycetaceae bacterium]
MNHRAVFFLLPTTAGLIPMWRGYSLRTLLFMIAGPLLMDLSNVVVGAWMNISTVHQDIAPRTQMWIGTLGPASFCVGAILADRLHTPRTALRNMTLILPVAAGLGIAPLYYQELWFFIVMSVAIGLMASQYFLGFQFALGHVRPFRFVAWSVAFYNIAWGSGFSIGSFLGIWAVTWNRNVTIAYILAINALHLVIILAARSAGVRHDDDHQIVHQIDSTPSHRRAAWVCGFVTSFVVVGTTSVLWLHYGEAIGLDAYQIALGSFLMLAPIPILTPVWAHFRMKVTRPGLMIATLPVQAAALIAVRAIPGDRWPLQLIPLCVIGASASMVYFQSIYYANADEQNTTRSVSVNEAILVVGCMVGPLVFGLAAWDDRVSYRPYIIGAALVIVATATASAIWHQRGRGTATQPR